MNLNISTHDLNLITEALVIYQCEIEDDTEDYYKYPYTVEQVQAVIDYLEKELGIFENQINIAKDVMKQDSETLRNLSK